MKLKCFLFGHQLSSKYDDTYIFTTCKRCGKRSLTIMETPPPKSMEIKFIVSKEVDK